MNGLDLINENFSKNTGISFGGIGALLAVGAAPWMIMVVAIVSILARESKDITKDIIKFKEKQNETKSNSNGGADSTDSKPTSPG